VTCETILLITANFLLVVATGGLIWATYLLYRSSKELNKITQDIGGKQAEHYNWERNVMEEANAPRIKFNRFILMIPSYDPNKLVIGGGLKNEGASDAKLIHLKVEDKVVNLSGFLLERGKSKQFDGKSDNLDFPGTPDTKSLGVVVSYSDLEGNHFQSGIKCKWTKGSPPRFEADQGSYWFEQLK